MEKNANSAISGNSGPAILSGIVAAIFVAMLAMILIEREVQQEMSSGSLLLLAQAEEIRDEGDAILNQLNSLAATECTENLLNRMRRLQFFAENIRDIGFMQNNHLICSTGRGVLDEPLRASEPDYVTELGVKFYSDIPVQLFGKTVPSSIAEKGNFNVVYDQRTLANVFPSHYRWELVYNFPTYNKHMAGEEGLFRDRAQSIDHGTRLKYHYYSQCDDQWPFCVGVEVDNLVLLQKHKGLIAMLVIACLMAGLATALSIDKFLKWHYSKENRIRRGLSRGSFYTLFQPIVELRTGRIVGCEVLARFRDPIGDIYPDEFIPIIARMKLTWPFTRQIIRQALDGLNDDLTIPENFRVNINLYPDDIASGQIRDLANVQRVMETRMQLNFEITEDQQLDTKAARENLEWIRDQGWHLAVDDFGAGYSNLSHIRDMSCDALKIDRGFVTGIENGGVLAAIVPMIVNLADELGLNVVAEGIETEEQRDVIRSMGVAYGQGWYFGKPMSADKFILQVVAAS